jgi:hypothetical protein
MEPAAPMHVLKTSPVGVSIASNVLVCAGLSCSPPSLCSRSSPNQITSKHPPARCLSLPAFSATTVLNIVQHLHCHYLQRFPDASFLATERIKCAIIAPLLYRLLAQPPRQVWRISRFSAFSPLLSTRTHIIDEPCSQLLQVPWLSHSRSNSNDLPLNHQSTENPHSTQTNSARLRNPLWNQI